MRAFKATFRPLQMGEAPGDPELGGWRPLRLPPVTLRPNVSTLQPGAADARSKPWLMSCVARVAMTVRSLAAKRAVSAVALRLSEGRVSMQ